MAKVTINQASQFLGIASSTILTWEKKKLVKSDVSANNLYLFDLEELRQFHLQIQDRSILEDLIILKNNQPTDFKVIELFAGCGGMALGLENAGLQTKLLVENNQNCVNTLQINRPNWKVLAENISQVDFREYQGNIDIVAGGFPCQAFSYAGHGRGFADTRGTLFFEFARCLQEVQPKIAIAENVRGLLSHQKGKTLSIMLETLYQLGYNTSYKLLRAQFLDVPQKRERVFIIATRQDLEIKPLFPQEKNYTISLRTALNNCPPSPGVEYNQRKREIMSMVPQGGNWRDLSLEIQKDYMKGSFDQGGGRTGFAKRLAWNEPCLTVTCSPAQTQTERCHPEETRPLQIREYARVQTFPDDWQFTGCLTAQYQQIGNAVPVNLAYHLGRCLINMLKAKSTTKSTLESPKKSSSFSNNQQLLIPGLTTCPPYN